MKWLQHLEVLSQPTLSTCLSMTLCMELQVTRHSWKDKTQSLDKTLMITKENMWAAGGGP